MDLVTLVVALAAFGVSIIAASAAWRQADATERAVAGADAANSTAKEALLVARRSAELDQGRRHSERRPKLTLEVVGPPELMQTVRLRNNGPDNYRPISVMLGTESEHLVTSLHAPSVTADDEYDEYELPLGLFVGGEAEFVLKRTSTDLAGRVYLYCHCWPDTTTAEVAGQPSVWTEGNWQSTIFTDLTAAVPTAGRSGSTHVEPAE